MSNEELNKKIVKWLGWEFHSDGKHWRMKSDVLGWSVMANLLDFPNDIRACLDYIMPKLNRASIAYSLGGYQAMVQLENGGKWETAENKNHALALCRAVEKLIDATG